MTKQSEKMAQLLKEIFIPASHKIERKRFLALNAAKCSGKCKSGSCKAV